MIRLIHFADVHIGMENYGRFDPEFGVNSRVRDFLMRFDELVKYADEHSADLAIFAGDAFKNYQPNPTLQREFAHRVRDLATICPVVLLIGNHDQPPSASRAFSVEIYDTLAVPNVTVGWEYKLHHIHTKNGLAQVATAPYPTRAQLLDAEAVRTLTQTQIDAAMAGQIQVLLRALAQQANAPDEWFDVPRVLTGHFTVSGAVNGIERQLMLGRDLEVPLGEVADPAWDYVAMGHIHKHQNLTRDRRNGPPVVYSGSLEAIDFGEEGESKGFCWVELERGRTDWHFQRVRSRPFVTLKIDVRGLIDPTEAALADIDEREGLGGAIVRVLIQLDADGVLNEKALRDRLYTSGVNYVTIAKVVERAAHSRLGENPEKLTDLQLLERYLRDKHILDAQRQLLLKKAQELIEVGTKL
ncbi:MAG: metallophosphoesterase family protein [Aggregatilineales bacterium]